MLGTNGGGFFNANSAHPFENPTPFSNLLEMFSIFLIPAGLTVTLGRMTGSPGHGWAVFAAMSVLFFAGVSVAYWAEAQPNPLLHTATMHIDQHASAMQPGGNMEGKEVRFGIANSALFATVTTDASCGAVNCMHDSFTPLGGLVPLVNIMLGEIIFGGVGAGLYGMLIFVILAVFIAGLMVGRTPEYLGKKIEAYRREDGHALRAHLSALHSRLLRHRADDAEPRPRLARQRRPARPLRDSLRLHLGHRQQRLRLRRAQRQHALVQHVAGRGHA